MCMSEAEFWWNHLTNSQRIFITQTNKFDTLYDVDTTMIELTKILYENREHFSKLPGWPATPMRTV